LNFIKAKDFKLAICLISIYETRAVLYLLEIR